ncbi:S-layer family protein, partial [Lactobacillus sp. HBUAS51381]
VTRDAGDNAGEYAYHVSGLNSNYTLGNESIGTLTITQAALNVSVPDQTMVYGGQEPTPTLTVTDANGNVVTDSGLTVTRVAGDNVGEYAYQVSGLSDNYTLGSESIGTLTITPATLNVNVPDQTMVYGGQEPTPTLTVTDANGNVVTDSGLTVTRDAGDNAGEYAYHVSGLNSNYTLGNESIGTLTITPAALNVTVANQTMVYGGQEPTPTLTVTDANGNIVTDSGLTVTREPGNTADTYHYLLNTDQLNANYKVDDPDLGILTIAKAALNVAVANQTMVYGGQEPTPTLTVTDANGNVVTDSGLTVTRKPGNTVGTYQYVLNTNQLNSNYTLSNESIGTLTITKAALNVTVANQTMVYGGQEPTPTLTVTDANGNIITDSGLTVTRDAGDNVGEYAYHVSGLNGNYTSDNESIGKLTITPAVLNVNVPDQTMVYGSQEPTPTLTVTDANGNIITDSGLTVTRDAGDNVGEYAYQVSGLSDNYTLGNESIGTLTITPATLNVSVPDQTMVYGGQEPTPVLTVTDANGNVVTDSGLTVTRDAGDNVGEYAYHVSGLNGNYTSDNESIGKLTITPATLNVSVPDQTMVYGGQEPTPILTVTDANGNVVTDSGLTVTRDAGDNAGTYAYHVSGLSGNYTLGNESIGALTITKLPLKVTVGSQTMVVGTKEPVATLTVVDGSGNSITDSGLTVTREPGNGVGTYLYILNADQLNANYKVDTSELGSLTITAAADTLTGSDYTMTVGDAAPTAADFKAAATDGNAQPVASDQITLDLGNADLTQPGQYQVTLSYGNAQPVTVTLTVVAKTTGGNGDGGNSGGTDPVEPTDPTDPTGPTDPTKPTDPSTPKDPDNIDHEIISDGGTGAQVRPGIDVTITTATRVPQRLVTSGAGAHIQTGKSGTPRTAAQSVAVAQHSGHDTQMVTSSKTIPVAHKMAPVDHKVAQQATTLPQTNEAHTSGWSILGLILGGLGLLGFRKRRQD